MTQSRFEGILLGALLSNESFMRKVLPFLKEEYFFDSADRKVFQIVQTFVDDYNAAPSIAAIDITLQNDKSVTEELYTGVHAVLGEIADPPEANSDWLLEQTEKFCKDRSLFNAISRSVQIIEGKDKEFKPDGIPTLLQNALAVSFDTRIGHDYLNDSEERFANYKFKAEKISFGLQLFDEVTDGGFEKKSISVVMAPTGKGKSIFLCNLASNILLQGKDTLYITLEMSERKIAERIDANLLDISLKELKNLDTAVLQSKFSRLREKTLGKLVIREYPTGSAHAGHFRALLSDLWLKQKFKPEVIIIDYINICASSRVRLSGSVNTNTYVKSIAEELRGLAIEQDVAMMSATQTNRGGFDNSDVGMTDTGESIGLPQTVDFMFALIQDDQMAAMMQVLIKQLKNRFGDEGYKRRFMIGLEKEKMRFFDLEPSAQGQIQDQDKTMKEYVARDPIERSKTVERNFDDIIF